MGKMKIFNILIFLLFAVFLFSCDSGGDTEKKPEQKSGGEATAPQIRTFEFTWSAICRCVGETGGRKEKGEHGKICSSDGTYVGQHKTEEEAVEKMEEDARKKMNCLEGPFLSFRYDAP
jgi:hypothetical protein